MAGGFCQDGKPVAAGGNAPITLGDPSTRCASYDPPPAPPEKARVVRPLIQGREVALRDSRLRKGVLQTNWLVRS